jgi:hypothetical protein
MPVRVKRRGEVPRGCVVRAAGDRDPPPRRSVQAKGAGGAPHGQFCPSLRRLFLGLFARRRGGCPSLPGRAGRRMQATRRREPPHGQFCPFRGRGGGSPRTEAGIAPGKEPPARTAGAAAARTPEFATPTQPKRVTVMPALCMVAKAAARSCAESPRYGSMYRTFQ